MIDFMYFKLLPLFIVSAWMVSCGSSKKMDSENHKYTNKLIHESSPYLLQHAHNPVDWFPWGDEALQKAEKENKLVIVSIGYSACHWCHVMEQESFEDTLVAKIMNENFVSIKVDREERPDVDDVYMTACNLISGRGGWPLNAVVLPDGRPVWAGTYFPKEQWIDILNQFTKLKTENYAKLEDSAKRIVSGLQQVDAVIDVKEDIEFTNLELNGIVTKFINNIDFKQGGRLNSPKFPMPNNYEFLLKMAYSSPDSRSLEAVNTTLTKMANGGIYDQIEGGFARYSTDEIWKVPHFEKMLYDNAQLVSLYSQAYRYTKNEYFRTIAEETLNFIEKNWQDDSGGFHSSYDADSEGEEGKFYVWKKSELSKIITDENEFKLFCQFYNVTENGNWEGSNILHTNFTDVEFSIKNNLDIDSFSNLKSKWKKLVLTERMKRTYPNLDDKIICSWNALVINAYIDSYKAFQDEQYRIKAIELWDFIEDNLLSRDGVTLKRNYKKGKSTINGFLDDYALTINAMIQLYEITFDEIYLSKANKLMAHVITHFKNDNSAMFNFTSKLDPPLIATKLELSDNVIPGSNSITARNLHSLGLLLYNNEYINLSKQMLRNMKNSILETSQPNFYSNWCNLYFDMVYDPYEIAILGKGYNEIRKEMMKNYLPNAIFLGGNSEGNLQLLEDKLREGEDLIYVCVNKACKFPVKKAEEAMKLLKN